MRFYLAIASLALGSVAFATAALAQSSSNTWTGPYAGVYAGYAKGHATAATTVGCPTGGFNCSPTFPGSLANGVDIARSGTWDADTSTFTGGIIVGHNLQRGGIVFGVEADFGAFDVGASIRRTGHYPFDIVVGGTDYTINTAIDTDWLATLRGRLGLAWDNALFYVTGGLALTEMQIGQSFQDTLSPAGNGSISTSSLRTGWVLGGGAELKLGANWTLRGEYLHVSFGSLSGMTGASQSGNLPVGTPGAISIKLQGDVSADIVRSALTYRF